jgi:hypothetical protein
MPYGKPPEINNVPTIDDTSNQGITANVFVSLRNVKTTNIARYAMIINATNNPTNHKIRPERESAFGGKNISFMAHNYQADRNCRRFHMRNGRPDLTVRILALSTPMFAR